MSVEEFISIYTVRSHCLINFLWRLTSVIFGVSSNFQILVYYGSFYHGGPPYYRTCLVSSVIQFEHRLCLLYLFATWFMGINMLIDCCNLTCKSIYLMNNFEATDFGFLSLYKVVPTMPQYIQELMHILFYWCNFCETHIFILLVQGLVGLLYIKLVFIHLQPFLI